MTGDRVVLHTTNADAGASSCPACGGAAKVKNTRNVEFSFGAKPIACVKRFRGCLACNHRYVTIELRVDDLHDVEWRHFPDGLPGFDAAVDNALARASWHDRTQG